MLPLRKVLGTKNPSDMMTKNVPCTTMEVYLNMLNLKFIDGRADIAQQLHSVGEMRCQRNDLDRLHFNNCTMPRDEPTIEDDTVKADQRAKDRHVDSWSKQGQGGRWTRVHRSARRSLFTPFKVAGGPSSKNGVLKRIRITRGKYLNNGKVCLNN